MGYPSSDSLDVGAEGPTPVPYLVSQTDPLGCGAIRVNRRGENEVYALHVSHLVPELQQGCNGQIIVAIYG